MITKLTGADSQVPHHGQQVESNLALGIPLYAALQDGNDLGRELVKAARAM
jgi:hypothetical protein